MTTKNRTWLVRILIIAVAGGAALAAWHFFKPQGLPNGFAKANGRMEAVEIDVATKTAGRVKEIVAHEGDFVRAGQVLATMDTVVLAAQHREAEAQLQRALSGIQTAQSRVTQAAADQAAARALVAQREAELDAARRRLTRSEELAPRGVVTMQTLDDDRARFRGAQASLSAAKAQVAAAEAASDTVKSEVIGAQSQTEAARAALERIQADIDDSVLRSPRDGRVQYRVAEPGEVLAAGGRVLKLVDLSDVHMTFFLPTAATGQVALGAEVHLVLDAAPQYVFPAQVSFVADVAQFTPKSVETEEERLKLMFRIKARVSPDLLRQGIEGLTRVKTGVPGMAYVRLDPNVEWPENLRVRVPE